MDATGHAPNSTWSQNPQSRLCLGLEAEGGCGSQHSFSVECFGPSISVVPTRWPYFVELGHFSCWVPRPGSWQRKLDGSICGTALLSARSDMGHLPADHFPASSCIPLSSAPLASSWSLTSHPFLSCHACDGWFSHTRNGPKHMSKFWAPPQEFCEGGTAL